MLAYNQEDILDIESDPDSTPMGNRRSIYTVKLPVSIKEFRLRNYVEPENLEMPKWQTCC